MPSALASGNKNDAEFNACQLPDFVFIKKNFDPNSGTRNDTYKRKKYWVFKMIAQD